MTSIYALDAKERIKRQLFQLEGVTGVGISSGSGPFLNVYVREMNEKLLQKIPEEANGLQTRIIETGDIVALQSRTTRMRPAIPGISLGHVSISAGTLGAIVVDNKTGKNAILSNSHVLVDYPPFDTMEDYEVLQPGVADGGTYNNDRIAETDRWIPLDPFNDNNLVDTALAIPYDENDINGTIMGLGNITGIEQARQDMLVTKSGRTTGITEGTILDTNASIRVQYGEFAATFEDQIVTTPMAEPGDSGSIVLNKQNNRAIGLLFAGSSTITILNKIQNVMSALDISIAGATPYAVQASGWPLLFLIGGALYYLIR
jgi:hypothetical protein